MKKTINLDPNKMYIKLKESAFYSGGGCHTQKEWDTIHENINILNKHLGEFVEVETDFLFNDQYNTTIEGHGIRLFDKDITEVVNDKRKGAVKCSYCGKCFASMDEYKAHIEAVKKEAHNCTNCHWFKPSIVDTIRTKDTETAENGDEIETNTTKYIWRKTCGFGKYAENGFKCCAEEHASEKFCKPFTPQNTYFLKYPKGYNGYFRELDFDGKMKELGFARGVHTDGAPVYYINNWVGSYNFAIEFKNGVVEHFTIWNKRRVFVIESDTLKELFDTKNYCCISRYVVGNKGSFATFPQSLERDLFRRLDNFRDDWRYKKHINEFLKF